MREWGAQFDLPVEVRSAQAARRITAELLGSWGYRDTAWIDAALVVLTELVANAIVHGGGCLGVHLRAVAGKVIVGAVDGSPQPPVRRYTTVERGGRGLALVEALARGWWVEPHPGGKRVLAELPTTQVAGQ